MNRRTQLCLALYGLIVIGLLLITPTGRPLRAQSATPGLIDYLGAQATANAVATQAAYQQQQSAASAAQSAAGLQAQAAALAAQAAAAQMQAAAQAQQATAIASQQQAALAAQQSTVDAAILQATVIAQQTRTALEISGQQTREALSAQATRSALDATRSAVALQATAEKRDAEAVSTAVYGSLEATRVSNASAQAAAQSRQETLSTMLAVVVTVIGLAVILVVLLLLGRWFNRQWRQLGRPQPIGPTMSGGVSTAALMVIDGLTGQAASRVGPIEIVLDSAAAQDLEQAFHAAY